MEVEAVAFVTTTVGESPAISCEMKGYIHPDSSFRWRREGNVLTNTSEKYTITYIEGNNNSARNGGADLVNSRFSALTIMNVDDSDIGEYTCFVEGTEVAADVQLRIGAVQATNNPSGMYVRIQ